MKKLPAGRGMYIWVLANCEKGNLDKIIAKCQTCGISWVAIKVGNGGSTWIPKFRKKEQFSRVVVQTLRNAGIGVYGWSYDFPEAWKGPNGTTEQRTGILKRQADVAAQCLCLGADGFISDSEYEWDRALVPDIDADNYLDQIESFSPSYSVIADAPWPYIKPHQNFPFTAFGKHVAFRCPQVYWIEIGPNVQHVCAEYAANWDKYESRAGHPKLPHFPSGSLYDKKARAVNRGLPPSKVKQTLVSVARALTFKSPAKYCIALDVKYFEEFAKARGCPGVLHWEWSQVPERIWTAFADGTIPKW